MLASENKLSNSRVFSILSKGLLESGHVGLVTENQCFDVVVAHLTIKLEVLKVGAGV